VFSAYPNGPFLSQPVEAAAASVWRSGRSISPAKASIASVNGSAASGTDWQSQESVNHNPTRISRPLLRTQVCNSCSRKLTDPYHSGESRDAKTSATASAWAPPIRAFLSVLQVVKSLIVLGHPVDTEIGKKTGDKICLRRSRTRATPTCSARATRAD